MWRDYTVYNTIVLELQATNASIVNAKNLQTRINRLITAASRMIDRWCLVPDGFFLGVAATRFFDILPNINGPMRLMRDVGVGESGGWAEFGGPTQTVMGIATGEVPRVAVDAMITVPDEVAVDQTLDGTFQGIMKYLTDYDLFPINANLDGYPFLELRWLPATATVAFPIGQRTLRIKSLWGEQPLTQSLQTLSLTGVPTGGTFTLSYSGQTTAPIAFDATGETVQQALVALTTLANLTGNYQGTSALQVSDGTLPADTLTIVADSIGFTGLTLGTDSLTGGTSPSVSLSTVTYTGPSVNPAIEQATIFQVIKWLKEPEAAPLGVMGSAEMGFSRVGPSDAVLEILIDGHFRQSWAFV